MNITIPNVAQWMMRLLVACLMVVMSASASLALSISGSVSYSGSNTGRVYLSVYWQDGNQTGLGTSIAAPGSYEIRGLQNGNYVVKAFMDTLGTGVPNTVDPLGQSGTVTISGTSQSGITVPLSDHSPTLPPPAPPGVMVTPGDNSALVMWEPPEDSNGFEAATSYNVYWSTESSVMATYETSGGSVTGIPASDDGHVFLPLGNGSELYFAVTSQIGGTVSSTAAVTPTATTIGTPSGGTSVSGTVSFSGTPPSGPLFIGINPPDGGPVAYTVISSPSFPQAFTVNGVPAGSYYIFAFIDANGSYRIDPGEPSTMRGNEPLILVSGASQGGIALQLSNASASIVTTTTHGRDSASDWYNLQFEIDGVIKTPVTVTLNSGPNITGPLDIGLSRWGGFQYNAGVPRPNVGDSYNFTLGYPTGSPESVNSQVTGVLDSFANPLTPVGDTYGPAVTTPTFAWEAPSNSPPAVYLYGFYLSQQYNWLWDLESLPMTQLSTPYNSNGEASQSSLSLGTVYNWTISLRDANGNQTQQQVSFTPRSTTAPSGSAGGTYTYNSLNGQLTLNWTSAAFPCDGPSVGTEIQNVTALTETTLSWSNGTDSMTWSRPGGTAGDIVGTWTTTDPSSGNTYSVTFNANGTMSVSATIYQCNNPVPQIIGFSPASGPVGSRITINGSNFDGNPFNNTVTINGTRARVDFASQSQLIVTVMGGTTSGQISVTTQNGTGTSATSFTVGPAPGSGNGTYSYVPGSPGTLTLNWTTVNYPCDGPSIGTEIQTVTTLDATTMIWQDGMTWSRISTEQSGIIGIWYTSDPGSGNSYTVTFNGDGTMTVSSAAIYQCSGDFQAPTVPTGVTAQAVSYSQINVNWNASSDNEGVSYYQVYRNGQPAGTPAGQSNTYWPDNFVAPSTTYSYTVAACDFSGNCSAQSSPPAQAMTPAIPAVPVFMIYGGVLHLASSDTFGVPVDALQIGIGKVGSSLGSMTASVSGPNGFSYTFSDADVRPYLGGQFEVYKEFPTPLEAGVYTFTLNDGNGNISHRVDTHANPQTLPAVDSATIQAQRKSDGSYRFTWAPVNDTKTYFYSLRINKADGTHTPVYNGGRKMDGFEDVPASILLDGTAYEVRVRVGDGPDFSLTFNQANSAYVSFTPQASDYDDSRLMFRYTNANNVGGDDPTFGFSMCTAAPTPVCGQTQANLVTSFTLTGPAGYSYTNSNPSTELTSPNNVDFSHKVPSAATGTYLLDVTANGKHHYAYVTLTPAVSYPTPVLANYKAEDLGNGSVRFSWADADQTGALYYRVFVKASNNSSSYTSSQRTNQTYADITKTQLGDLTWKQWRVEVYDSSAANTQRNRINGPFTTSGSLNTLPVYDANKPVISQFRFRNLKHPGGNATDIVASATDADGTLSAVSVDGPNGFIRNLQVQGQLSGSTYTLIEPGTPATGLYTLNVTDNSANSVARYNQQPTPHDVPLVDYRTFRVNLDANGDARFSWAPVVTDVPLWYSLDLVSVNTLAPISTGINNVQQASVTITAANMQTYLMQGSLMFRVRANDGSNWTTSNNISQSAFAGYGTGTNYATLTDNDSDGFASNVDANDSDPSVNPAAASTTYSVSGRVTDTGSSPVSGVEVSVFNSTNLQFLFRTTTDSNGYYSVSGLTPGSYKVQFYDPSLAHDATWYNGRNDGIGADTVVLNAAVTTFIANATLTSGLTGGISGRVTDGANGIAGVWVGANIASNLAFTYGAITNADGYYTIGGLPSGDYKVYFAGNSVGYQNLWHFGALTPDTASPVFVTAPTYFTDLNAVLVRAGGISGRVTNTSLTGIANVLINVHDATSGTWLANAMTDGLGDYTVNGLSPGSYKVSFDGSSAGYGRQWYNSKADIANANPVTVSSQSTTPGINGTLPVAGSISGSVTAASAGLSGVSVTVYDAVTGIWVTSSTTDTNGNYLVNGLPTGSYKLQYAKTGYTTQWYSNKTSQAAADTVSVTAPGTTPLSAVAMQSVNVNGFVYNTSGLPVAGATVSIVGNPALTATTGADGSYAIYGIPLNQNFQVMASMGGYVTAYSTTFNTPGNSVFARELLLLTAGDVGGGISPTTGAIFGQTILGGGGGTTIDGVTVSIVSGGPYTVLYDDGFGNYFTGRTTTSFNGRFFIPNIADGATIVLGATRPGWTLNNQKTYVVHANGVTNGNLAGLYTTTTAVTLASGSNPSYYGETAAPAFTATVSPSTATGTVQFKVDGVNIGSPVALVSGSATSTAISSVMPGAHTVTAVFSNNGTGYSGSTSAGLPQTVNDRVKIGSIGNFLTLQSAIDTALNNETLLMRDIRFKEELTVDYVPIRRPSPVPFTITLKGGLGSDFTTPAATASSARKLTIKNGKVIAYRFVVKPD